ncbi:cold shock protein 2-like, partial [Acyrthosiphon pisum]|uniref:CCHC-type domain-containing protein n=1 Tax=Acyrthosiphon pisum TaxID=7029 RepID=A0A8R2JVU7_ACYPI
MNTVYNISGSCTVFIGNSDERENRARQCYNCGKPGHPSRDCAKPRGGSAKRGGGRGGGGGGGVGGGGGGD